eukprot:6381488-Amphidinium_carterae.2
MGLGKTAQTLCFLENLKSAKPHLIVAPASIMRTWETEDRRAYKLVITTPHCVASKVMLRHSESRVETRRAQRLLPPYTHR